MTQTTDRKYLTRLYFKPKQSNGKPIVGKNEVLTVRFLYDSPLQIPQGRVHLYSYAKGKYTNVLCLKNELTKNNLDKVHCPLCEVERYGTPSKRLWALVEDIEDGEIKLIDLPWSVLSQLEAVVETKAVPLHDLIFQLTKSGTGKETTYAAIFDEKSKFNVRDFLISKGYDKDPAIVGKAGDRAPIMALTEKQMEEFINGNYPWSNNSSTSNGDGSPKKSYTVLGSSVVVHGYAGDAFKEEEELVGETSDFVEDDLVSDDNEEPMF